MQHYFRRQTPCAFLHQTSDPFTSHLELVQRVIYRCSVVHLYGLNYTGYYSRQCFNDWNHTFRLEEVQNTFNTKANFQGDWVTKE